MQFRGLLTILEGQQTFNVYCYKDCTYAMLIIKKIQLRGLRC